MGALILETGCTISCPHGGRATVIPGNRRVKVDGKYALLTSDNMLISGCLFMVSGVSVPCLKIRWEAPAARNTVKGVAVLLQTSVGLCLNAAEAPQGKAIVSGTQTKVKGA